MRFWVTPYMCSPPMIGVCGVTEPCILFPEGVCWALGHVHTYTPHTWDCGVTEPFVSFPGGCIGIWGPPRYVPPFQCLGSMGPLSPASSLLGACIGFFSPPIHMPPPYMGAMGSLSPESPSPGGGEDTLGFGPPHILGVYGFTLSRGVHWDLGSLTYMCPPFCSQRPRKRMPVARNAKTLSTKQLRTGKGAPVTENVAPEKVRPGWETGGTPSQRGAPCVPSPYCVAGGELPGQAVPVLAPGGAQEALGVRGPHQRECCFVGRGLCCPPESTPRLTSPLFYFSPAFLALPPQNQAHKNQAVAGKKDGVKSASRKAPRAPPAKNNEANPKK